MKKGITTAITLLALLCAGCASQIMQRYVGQPLTAPVFDYGPPAAVFDMDKATRAFMWTMQHSYTTPGYATTTGTVSMSGTGTAMGDAVSMQSSGFYDASTRFTPPQTFNWACNYVLLAQRNGSGVDGPAGWSVISFRKPSLACE